MVRSAPCPAPRESLCVRWLPLASGKTSGKLRCRSARWRCRYLLPPTSWLGVTWFWPLRTALFQSTGGRSHPHLCGPQPPSRILQPLAFPTPARTLLKSPFKESLPTSSHLSVPAVSCQDPVKMNCTKDKPSSHSALRSLGFPPLKQPTFPGSFVALHQKHDHLVLVCRFVLDCQLPVNLEAHGGM